MSHNHLWRIKLHRFGALLHELLIFLYSHKLGTIFRFVQVGGLLRKTRCSVASHDIPCRQTRLEEACAVKSFISLYFNLRPSKHHLYCIWFQQLGNLVITRLGRNELVICDFFRSHLLINIVVNWLRRWRFLNTWSCDSPQVGWYVTDISFCSHNFFISLLYVLNPLLQF